VTCLLKNAGKMLDEEGSTLQVSSGYPYSPTGLEVVEDSPRGRSLSNRNGSLYYGFILINSFWHTEQGWDRRVHIDGACENLKCGGLDIEPMRSAIRIHADGCRLLQRPLKI
jgi:hypothetical protein